MIKVWKHRTQTGKIVYPRKPHTFSVKDALRICVAITQQPEEWIGRNIIACRSLHVVVREGIYPYYLNYILKNGPGPRECKKIYSSVEIELKKKTRKQIIDIYKAVTGFDRVVLDWVANTFLDFIYDPIWRAARWLFGK